MEMNCEEELEAELQRVRLEHAAALYEQGMKNIARMYYELNKARREEREECAKVCDAEVIKLGQSREALVAGICAASIRARGEQ